MAVSSSLATSFTGLKLETTLFLNSVSSSRSSSQSRVLCKPSRLRRSLIHRAANLNPRCEVVSDAVVDTESNRSSSVSALEQLKISAADSGFSFPLFYSCSSSFKEVKLWYPLSFFLILLNVNAIVTC